MGGEEALCSVDRCYWTVLTIQTPSLRQVQRLKHTALQLCRSFFWPHSWWADKLWPVPCFSYQPVNRFIYSQTVMKNHDHFGGYHYIPPNWIHWWKPLSGFLSTVGAPPCVHLLPKKYEIGVMGGMWRQNVLLLVEIGEQVISCKLWK